jgi:hypothetical protein
VVPGHIQAKGVGVRHSAKCVIERGGHGHFLLGSDEGLLQLMELLPKSKQGDVRKNLVIVYFTTKTGEIQQFSTGLSFVVEKSAALENQGGAEVYLLGSYATTVRRFGSVPVE